MMLPLRSVTVTSVNSLSMNVLPAVYGSIKVVVEVQEGVVEVGNKNCLDGSNICRYVGSFISHVFCSSDIHRRFCR